MYVNTPKLTYILAIRTVLYPLCTEEYEAIMTWKSYVFYWDMGLASLQYHWEGNQNSTDRLGIDWQGFLLTGNQNKNMENILHEFEWDVTIKSCLAYQTKKRQHNVFLL